MLKTLNYKSLVAAIALITVVSATCPAQVTTGVPPYQSFGGGPDVINLGNLNVHYSIPVFSRAGRGTPFSYALAYDSSIWTPSTSWVPNSNWGLHRDTAALVGYVKYSYTSKTCNDPYGGTGLAENETFSAYVDPAGTSHPIYIHLYSNDCFGGNTNSGPSVSGDGSGIKVVADWGTATVTLKSGEVITPQLLSGTSLTGNGSSEDRNGNEITSSTVSGTTTFTDTLGTTGGTALTITGTAPSPVYYKYTAPSGALVSVTATFKSYTVQTNFGCSGISEYGPLSNSLVDKVTLPDGSYYQFGYETTPADTHSPHYVTGRIASLRLPTGGTISYAYTGSNNGIMCADGSTAGLDRSTPDGTWHYVRSGTSPAYTTTITTPADPKTGQTNQTVINFQGNFEVGRQVYEGSASGTPLETGYTCYNGNGITNPSSCVTTAVTTPFTQITKFRQFNGGQLAEVNTLYDGYGNVTETDAYDYGASTPTQKTLITYDTTLGNGIVDHPSSVIAEDGANNLKSKTTYAYDETTPQATTGTPQHVAVTCATGFTKCRGNATTITTYSTSTATLTRTVKYYDTGNVYQSQDVNGQWITYTYGSCGNSFLTNESMPLSLSKSSAWNCTGGVMTSATDENGNISYINYTTDPYFWRPESTKDPLLYVTSLSYPSIVKAEGYLNFNGTISTVDALKQLDGLGRSQYTQRKQSQAATNYDTVRQIYDSFGRPYQVTMPYVATSASPGPPTGTPIASTTYYDALGRPIQIVDGGGGQLNVTYSGRDAYQEIAPKPGSDSNTKRKQSEYDGLGRLISVCEITGGANSGPCNQDTSQTGYRTAYVYDTAPNVNSLTVTQNVQTGGGTSQTRTYISDMLGRLTQETNPETGTTTYGYDSDTTCTGGYPAGNMVKRTDAVGNVTCYTYDQLHRLLSITYPSGSYATNTDTKYFVYDSATVGGAGMQNPKGRLAEAYTCPPTGSCTSKKTDLGFSYSARGEMAAVYEKTPNSGSTYYQVSASYWANGGIDSLSSNVSGLPTMYYGSTDGSGLDGEGRVTKVTASSGQSPLVSAVAYTASGTTQPIGSLTQVTFGSSDYDTFSYDVNTGRMNQYKFTVGATPRTVTGNLTWNANGSLGSLAITDQFNSANTQTCNYSQDDLGRIATANCGTPWNQTFTFDPFGNIKKNATAGISFTPTYSLSTNRYSSVPGCTPSYDANGFATNDCAHSYAWDSAGNPRTIDSASLTYDALGRMVEQASGSTYIQIVYAPTGGKLALMNGQTLNKAFVPLPAGAAAVYTSTGLTYYRHSDWLGSGRLATTPTRALSFDVAYGPYGENYAASGSGDLNFTGQNQDTVSGLFDFLFREYNANQGRWPWPDPAGLGAVSMGSPQTWNRYAYVGNMPLTSVDDLGLLGKMSDCTTACRAHGLTYSGLSWLSEFVDILNLNHDAFTTEVSSRMCFEGSCGSWSDPTKIVYDAYTLVGASMSGGSGNSGAANNGNCGTTSLPRSFGVSYGGNADAGAGYEGISATGSAGAGVFYNGNTGASTGKFAGGGATAYFFNGNIGAPKQQGQPFNFGGYAGAGPSVWISNAGGAPQLGGPFTTLSLNVGAGLVKGSLQLSYGGGIWQLSIGPPIPYVSAGTPSISVSKITTKTVTTSGCH